MGSVMTATWERCGEGRIGKDQRLEYGGGVGKGVQEGGTRNRETRAEVLSDEGRRRPM